MPAIREQLGQINVNDYVSMDTDVSLAPSPANVGSEDPLQTSPEVLGVAGCRTAPSLYGAEAEIGDLNMASPDVGGVSDVQLLTLLIQSRHKRPILLLVCSTKSTEKLGLNDAPQIREKDQSQTTRRRCRIQCFHGSSPNSRAQIAAAKTNTSQNRSTSHPPSATIEMARTIDAQTGKSVSINDFPNPPRRNSIPLNLRSRRIDLTATEIIPAGTTTSNSPAANSNPVPPPRLLGTLKTTAVSYMNLEIHSTTAIPPGSCTRLTISHPDKVDTRIPRSRSRSPSGLLGWRVD